ncbi:MAG: hypothetical protein LBK26_03370 [Rickettsiales bacterium]|nr:hypothetical protein [Rickettsiales bacterium]
MLDDHPDVIAELLLGGTFALITFGSLMHAGEKEQNLYRNIDVENKVHSFQFGTLSHISKVHIEPNKIMVDFPLITFGLRSISRLHLEEKHQIKHTVFKIIERQA